MGSNLSKFERDKKHLWDGTVLFYGVVILSLMFHDEYAKD